MAALLRCLDVQLAFSFATTAARMASKGEDGAARPLLWLRDPNYDTLKLRLENAHAAAEAAAVEARRRVRLNEA